VVSGREKYDYRVPVSSTTHHSPLTKLIPINRDAIEQFTSVEDGHHRFLGELLEVVAGNPSRDHDRAGRLFNGKISQSWNGTLPQSEGCP